MKGIYYSLFLFFSLCHDGHTQAHAGEDIQAQSSNDEVIVNLAESKKDISGEYILNRPDRNTIDVESFPKKKEYERIIIQKKNKKYDVTYFGARLYSATGLIPLEEDIALYFFFATKAEDVKVEGNKISFAIKDRYMYPLDYAPRTSKEADKLKRKHLYLFKISSPILMECEVDGHKLNAYCQGVDCVTNEMVFIKQ